MGDKSKRGRGGPGGRGEAEVVSTDVDLVPVLGPSVDEATDGVEEAAAGTGARRLPRLARHEITLADGHQVGVTVCGRGVPIVLITKST